MTALSTTDPTSFSNPEDVIVTHIDLELAVDFKKHIFSGDVHLSLQIQKTGTDTVMLDTRDVTVHSVRDKDTGQQLTFTLGEAVKQFGSKLEIKLPSTADKKCVITINYETSPECSALQWLKKEQTAGGRQPYLYSQCQAIHCRSMIPCQDTPYVKCPYTAKITAPSEIKILMSALLTGSTPCAGDTGKTVYSFKQDVVMPSYLIAIVGGDLVSREIGPRSKVWCEQEFIDQAAYEFAETEQMLQTAEKLLGPYVWGHYDLLVLPPTFPYGGMENPCLTFVTPTLLAGDRSLADVVAHEISHSWTGNLVTNNNFEHFWLNEGNTVFVEHKIAKSLKKDSESYRQFLAFCGWNTLQETVDVLGAENPYTRLIPDLKGVDPDDAFSAIPYEKGHALLFYLESLLGGPEYFEPFMRAYIEKFKYKSISTQDWKDFLMEYFHDKVEGGALSEVDWEGWLYGLGMPPVKPTYDMTMTTAIDTLVSRWLDCEDSALEQFLPSDIESFMPTQTLEFLSILLTKDALSHAKIARLGEVYKLNSVNNSEIKFRWLRVCIRARVESIIPAAIKFVTEQGRMKFTKPLYKDLYDWDVSKAAAIKNFNDNRGTMHSTTVATVAKALNMQ